MISPHGNEPEVQKLTTQVHRQATKKNSIPLLLHWLITLLSQMSIFPTLLETMWTNHYAQPPN
jgi:hypothetical protein